MSWVPGEHRFGCVPDFSIGVEEELLLVDPERLCLKADSDRVIAALNGAGEGIKAEIFAAEIELNSPPSRTVADAIGSLAGLRAATAAAGAAMLGSGTHPDGRFGDAAIHDKPRYHAVEDALGGVLRTPTCALHVHVAMPDPETAIRVANAMRLHVPLIDALAANSPFWHGVDSGLASARTAVLRSYPRLEMPREFDGWEDFCARVTELTEAAKVEDYTLFWWDVRPHPLLGTVEIRSPDVQCSLDRTAALAALIQSLAKLEIEDPLSKLPSRESLAEYAFAANRYGLRAEVPTRSGRTLPAAEAAEELLDLAKPHARELGCESELEGVAEIAREGNGADRQRAVFGRRGMKELLLDLMRRTQPMAVAHGA
jgi:glutamate---cysteine ligase / carboxylate-amine ligase